MLRLGFLAHRINFLTCVLREMLYVIPRKYFHVVFDPNSVPFHTVPMVAPGNVQVHVINSTLAKVHWDPVPLKSVRGHLQGYKVSTIKSLLFSFIKIDHFC